MANINDIHLRAARDRLIDLLGFGETYPLQNVEVPKEQIVSYGVATEFPIKPGQMGVTYELYEGVDPVRVDDKPLSVDVQVYGETATLPGPVITADKTFRIRAVKIDWPQRPERPAREAFLLDEPNVTVGLNTGLAAELNPPVADYHADVTVTVKGSQKGAKYRLAYIGAGGVEVFTDDRSLENGGDLGLDILQVENDTMIRIQAMMTFDASEEWQDLVAKLPLAVRPNPKLGVSIVSPDPPLADPAEMVTLTIAASQTSVKYSAYVRTLIDEDFELDPPPGYNPSSGDNVLTVWVPESLDVLEHDVWVKKPPQPTSWPVQHPYMQTGDENPIQGTGANLPLAIGPFVEDSIVVIKAEKDHSVSGLGLSGTSALQLEQVVVVLVRPERPVPPALTLTLDTTNSTLLVSGGQQGVFYHFRPPSDPPAEPKPEIGLPAYFHRLDVDNKGVDNLRIGMDFVIVRDTPAGEPPPDPPLEVTPPPDPLLEVTLDPPAPAALDVMAVKARTRVAWAASQRVQIMPPIPEEP